MGYTIFDYDSTPPDDYQNGSDSETLPPVYYDEKKGVYVFTVDPETGEEIPREQYEKPMTPKVPSNSRKTSFPWLLAGGAIAGLYFLTR